MLLLVQIYGAEVGVIINILYINNIAIKMFQFFNVYAAIPVCVCLC